MIEDSLLNGDKELMTFFGKRTYQCLNYIIKGIVIIGIIGCIIAYFVGLSDIFNIYTVGSLLIFVILSSFVIMGVIRGIEWLIRKK